MDKFIQGAIETYERYVNGMPNFYTDADTLMQIEEYYEKAGRTFDAQMCIHIAQLLHPDNVEVLLARAYMLKSEGNWEDAQRIIKNIPNQNHREVILFKAEWNIMSGKPEMGEYLVKQAVDEEPDETVCCDWYIDLGEVLMNYGYLKRAIVWLEKISESYYDYKHTLELLADAYNQMMDFEHAQAAAMKITDKAPYDSMAWCMLADIQQKYEHYEESLTSVEYALAINPKSKLGMSLKVFNTFALGHKEEAIKLAEQYIKRVTSDYSIDMYAAENCMQDSEQEKTLQHIYHALGNCPINNPDRVRLLTDLSMLYALMRQPEKAEEALMATLASGISLTDILWKTHHILYNSGMVQESLKPLARLAAYNNLDESERIEIYKLLVRSDWFVFAKEVWLSLLSQPVPNDKFCRIYLAYAMYALKEKEPFSQQLSQCLKEAPDETIQFFGPIFSDIQNGKPAPSTKEDLEKLAQDIVNQWDRKRYI